MSFSCRHKRFTLQHRDTWIMQSVTIARESIKNVSINFKSKACLIWYIEYLLHVKSMYSEYICLAESTDKNTRADRRKWKPCSASSMQDAQSPPHWPDPLLDGCAGKMLSSIPAHYARTNKEIIIQLMRLVRYLLPYQLGFDWNSWLL